MNNRSSRGRSTIAASLVVLALAACGDAQERPSEDAAAMPPADSAIAPDTTGTAEPSPAEVSDDPFAGFELEAGEAAGAEPRRLSLRLVNAGEELAIVFADGGAGEVLLDSVPPQSEARVDVLTRAPAVTLRSVGSSGAELRTTEVTLGPDTVVAVRVGAGPGRS